jgi:hypothetical protein
MLGGTQRTMRSLAQKIEVGIVAVLLASCGSPSEAPFVVDAYTVAIDDILPIAYQLAEEGNEGSFVVFFFSPSGNLERENGLNIQFSIEQGIFGFDWVLTSPDNVEGKGDFQAFAESRGYIVESRAGNGVEYLRVEEGGSLFTLGRAVITEL